MKKIYKYLALLPIFTFGVSSLSSCSTDNSVLYLRVINSEDYIYLQESDDDPEDLTIQFENSDLVADFLENKYPQYKKIKVIYDTSDTNETLYSELQTGKSNYDLMNVSDYMAQKIVSGGLAVPLYQNDCEIPNYEAYASRNIKERLDNIIATQKVYNKDTKELEKKELPLKDYAVGYMWGTLGILFNPTYFSFSGMSEEEVFDTSISDMQSFNALWDTKYKGTISIKNSMRDTYALGVMHTYDEEFKAIRDEYLESGDLEKYQTEFAKIFNRCEKDQVSEVAESLDELKNNIFGLEVDSGKQDIITQKIGINLAWSGDAVYSMDQANDLNEVKELVDLYYAIPENGSNLWMDAWIMPKCPRSEAQYELAHLFLDFLSDPEVAYQNMDYTGYTSFIGGNSIIELVRDWYDYRTGEISYEVEKIEKGRYVYYYYDVYSFNEEDFTILDYPDLLSTDHDSSRDEELLCYFIPYTDKETKEEVEEPSSLEELLEHSSPIYLTDDEGEFILDEENNKIRKTYGNLTIVDDPKSGLEVVDLTYFFKDTLIPTEEVEYIEGVDTLFYSDCYLPFYNEDESHNISVGRQFFCQYPDKDTLDRCAVMADYGENNQYVMKMWENFKSDPLPTWAIILFIVFTIGILGFMTYLVINHILKSNLRKKRLEK